MPPAHAMSAPAVQRVVDAKQRRTFLGRTLATPAAVRAPQSRRAVATRARANELSGIPLQPVIDARGWVFPTGVALGTNASIFAIYDSSAPVARCQYVGFSKDLRNSLRTLLGRRPELCHSFRAYHYAVLDQEDMMMQRKAWLEELGEAPPGNAVAAETAAWTSPRDFASRAEAEQANAALQAVLLARGIGEDMEADGELLAAGRLDIRPSACNTEQALAAAAARRDARGTASASREVVALFPGVAEKGHLERVVFEVFFTKETRTNGGWMFDILCTPEGGAASTTHRVIVGKEYSDAAGCSAQELACHSLAWLLHLRTPMVTEGILSNSQFPSNYYNLSLVEQWWPAFGERHKLLGPNAFWRFNRLYKYGFAAERYDSLMLGPGHLSEPGN